MIINLQIQFLCPRMKLQLQKLHLKYLVPNILHPNFLVSSQFEICLLQYFQDQRFMH